MNTIQSTIYGAKLLASLLMGQTPIIDEKSTLNERLDIMPNARPTSQEKVYLGVLMVGNRGHRVEVGAGGIPLISMVDHTADHAAPYGPVPLCMRPIDDDLTLQERAKYALRKEMMVSGQTYYAYFGLRLNVTADDVTVQMKKITRDENGIETEEVFAPTTNELWPEPIELPTEGAITAANVRLSTLVSLRVSLDARAVEEFIEAAKILNNGDERYAVISECALCTGADRIISVNSTSGLVNFKETIAAQVYSFSSDHKAVYYNSQSLTFDFNIGGQVPLLAAQAIPTII